MLQFDFHLAWKNRPDLWNWFDPDHPGYNPNNKYNVEWHGWDGPPNKVRYLNWGVLERLPPNMCFTSKRTRAEVTRIDSKVIGPVLREELGKLKAEGKETLFAGILVGSEPSIDDYSQPNPERTKMMKEDGVPAGPLGYRALLDRGFSADHPPDNFRQALAKIVQDTIAFWCEQFVDAGISAGKLYPHVAAPAPIEGMKLGSHERLNSLAFNPEGADLTGVSWGAVCDLADSPSVRHLAFLALLSQYTFR